MARPRIPAAMQRLPQPLIRYDESDIYEEDERQDDEIHPGESNKSGQQSTSKVYLTPAKISPKGLSRRTFES